MSEDSAEAFSALVEPTFQSRTPVQEGIGDLAFVENGKRDRLEIQSCRVEGVRRRYALARQTEQAFALLPWNSADRSSTISSTGSMARVTSADYEGILGGTRRSALRRPFEIP